MQFCQYVILNDIKYGVAGIKFVSHAIGLFTRTKFKIDSKKILTFL